ncbi:MAG: thiolase family protein [Candidatus Yanofskybacteria bacterium]|nr:thiolase family protein [Candidatus Yanofskybacteria bacterium]
MSHKCSRKSDDDAVIVAACRTPVGKFRGALSQTRPDDLGAIVVRELLKRVPQLNPFTIDDVIFGCAFPEAQQGMNVARIISLLAELPITVPGMTINRFCSSGLQAISFATDRIKAGGADVIIAGGVESMSMVPMTGNKFEPHPMLLNETQTYISTIGGAEVLRKLYAISRQEQDEFALWSHQKAIQAQDDGKFMEEIVPVKLKIPAEAGMKEILFENDEGPRRSTSLEKLAKLEPIEKDKDPDSTVTAGNASQMSDGAAVVMLMSRVRAKRHGIKPLARLVDYAVTALEPKLFGIGPVAAIPKVLRRASLDLKNMDLIELNEAFAVQMLAVMRELPLSHLNVNGGAIALGHPLGCSGARIAATLIYEMRRRGVEFGLEAMCVGGGMGAAGIFQLED